MAGEFDGLEFVVTGGTGALGSAVVECLLGRGGSAVVPVFHPSELDRFDARDHDRVEIVESMDLTQPGAVDALYARFGPGRPLWGSLHIAGGFAMGKLEGADATTWDKMMSMNGRTAYLCTRAAVLAMRGDHRDGGRVVNVSARPGLRHADGAGMVPYAVSKAAVAAMTQAIAAEVKADGIWVNAIAPSIIDTPANRKAMPDADHDSWPKVSQLAATICWLASPANEATSGCITPVYGRA